MVGKSDIHVEGNQSLLLLGCGKSKVTHLSRVDLMGRSNEWDTKAYGSVLSRSMTKLRDSFAHFNTGPETKV